MSLPGAMRSTAGEPVNKVLAGSQSMKGPALLGSTGSTNKSSPHQCLTTNPTTVLVTMDFHSTNIQLTGQFVAGRICGVTTSISMEIDPTNPTSYTLLLGVLMWDTSVCSHTNQTCKVYMVSQYAPQAVHAPPPLTAACPLLHKP